MDWKLNTITCSSALDYLKELPSLCVNCCVTSPPYWNMRDYGSSGQIGLEKTPEEYTETIVDVFREVRRVLREDGTLWLNIGDCYASAAPRGGGDPTNGNRNLGDSKYPKPSVPTGLKQKDLVGIPWRVAFALQADGWYLRQDIIWNKPNAMPESVRDRCTNAHEYIFLLSKSHRYFFDESKMREPAVNSSGSAKKYSFARESKPIPGQKSQHRSGRDDIYYSGETRKKRSVWTVATRPFRGAHFAVFPMDLITPCIKAGCPVGGIVLDPFMGSGTTAIAALSYGVHFLGCDLSREFIEMAESRIDKELGLLLST